MKGATARRLFAAALLLGVTALAGPFFVACGIYRPHLPFRVPQRIWNQWFDAENKALPWISPPSLLPGDIDDLGPFGRAMARGIAFGDPSGIAEPATSQHDQIVAAGLPENLAHVVLSGEKDAGAWYDNLAVVPQGHE